jgi:MFS family permease
MVERRLRLSVLGCFFVQFVLGSTYITGNVAVYFASYLRLSDASVTLPQVNTILPIQICISTMCVGLGTRLYLKFGPRFTIALGNSMVVAAVFCTSLVNSLAGYLLLYGVLYGAGAGIAYCSPLMLSWSQYPQYKARMSGIVLGGYGLGSAVFNLVATSLVNPHNRSPDDKEHDGDVTYHYFSRATADNVPTMLRWLSLIYLLISAAAVLLLFTKQPSSPISDEEQSAPSVTAALKTRQFWLLFAASLSSVFYGYYIAATYKSFGNEAIGDDDFMATVGAVSSFCNGSARFVWAYLMELTSFRTAYMTLLTIQTILSCTIYFTTAKPMLFMTWVCSSLACEGGHFVLFAAVMARLHGKVMGGRVYGVFFFNFGLSGVLVLFTELLLTSSVGYLPVFLLCSAMSAASLATMGCFKESSPWSQERNKILIELDGP